MRFADTKSLDRSRIKLRKIDPRRVILLSSWMSGRTQVIYRFDEQFVNQIKASRLFQVNETPIALLQAISNGEDFLFNEDEIFHFRAPTISGVSNHGWGLPETMANYRSLHQLMVYRRIDEAVGLDYILPWRILSPNLGDKLGDLADLTNLGMWKQSIADMIARQRKDPFAVHALPFPVEYQEANGKGKEIVPKDLIEWQVNNMLDGYGIPAELFRGTLAFAAQPTALRLFQNNFRFIYSGFNKFLKWSSKGSQDFLQQERLTPKLQQPTIADDMEAKSVYLQLAAGGDLSRSTAYAGFNVNDPVAEALKRMKEDMAIQQGQQKLQAEAQRQQELGSLGDVAAAEDQASGADGSFPGSGAAGAPPTNQGGLTPMDAQQKAMDLAQQWAACPDNGQRAKMMRQAEATDQMTYALAKQLWEKMKADGASQGRKAVTSGQAGGQGGGQAPPPQ
jgi:hypothetical protein